MGAAILIGGLRHGTQTFNAKIAGANVALLTLAVIGLFVPAIFALTTSDRTVGSITEESVLVSVILIIGYVLSLIFQFTHPDVTLGGHGEPAGHAGPAWSARVAIAVLIGAAALLAVLSEILVSSIGDFISTFALSAFFVGVVIIPTIGNLAEHLVAVQLAAKDKMEFALAVTFGSSLQVALFVAPVLVLLGALIGQPMDLVFTPLEIAAVAAAVGISALIAIDGETNWLEGALLVLVYTILAVSFFEFT
jgi:Ca2+:H+ antiporter